MINFKTSEIFVIDPFFNSSQKKCPSHMKTAAQIFGICELDNSKHLKLKNICQCGVGKW
jgi:hypothetical protein